MQMTAMLRIAITCERQNPTSVLADTQRLAAPQQPEVRRHVGGLCNESVACAFEAGVLQRECG
eukprot:1192935-Rhodomonas_salina.1